MLDTLTMRYLAVACWLLPGVGARGAITCNPFNLSGPYAFQLSGISTISGRPQQTVVLGRITMDGNGNLNGTSSAMFTGLLLGNPITGNYTANTDCSITFQFRDDSGGFQHFAGTYTQDYKRISFQQTDPGGPSRGLMLKSADACTPANLRQNYSFSLSGFVIPMQSGSADPGNGGTPVSGRGTIDTVREGDFHVESDCSVRFTLTLRDREGAPTGSPMQMRGQLVDGGKEILAMETDPGAMVSARLQETP